MMLLICVFYVLILG